MKLLILLEPHLCLSSEDTVSERRRKLEFLEMQEELIKEEEKRKAGEDKAKLKESNAGQIDVALDKLADQTPKEAEERAKDALLDTDDQLNELSRALAVLASASSVSREREEFVRLVNKEVELYNSMVEGKEGEVEAEKAYRAAYEGSEEDSDTTTVSSALIDRVDAMLQKLEKEIDDVDAKISDRWRLLDRDYDGKVTPEEVASAAAYLKDTLHKDGEKYEGLIKHTKAEAFQKRSKQASLNKKGGQKDAVVEPTHYGDMLACKTLGYVSL